MQLPSRSRLIRYLALFVPYLGLLATWDLAGHPVAMLCWFAAAIAALVWARCSAVVPTLHVLLLVAAGMRLILLPLPPSLSDDVYRYLWDGRVAAAGFNPYELAPNATELTNLRDDLWQALPHRNVATVYPPLALTLFSIAAKFPWPLLLWKSMLIVVDLATCLFLFRLAAHRGGDGVRAVWYAWNPLVTLEVAGMGHLDALGVCAVVIAVWALVAGRKTAWIALAAAAGVLIKLIPILAFPVWLRRSRRRAVFVGLSVLVLAAAFGPVLVASRGLPSGYLAFGGSWEFNGPLYEPLWRVLESVDARSHGERLLDSLKAFGGNHEFWNRFYPFNYPRMHARFLLAVLFSVLAVRIWRKSDVIGATGSVFELLVLCSATVYPWYLLWLLPFAALAERSAWLVLSSMSVLSYLAQFTEVPLMPWVFIGCWGPYALIRGAPKRWFAA